MFELGTAMKSREAIDLISVVKQRFINHSSKFDEFTRIVISLNSQQHDHTRLLSKLKTLFQTHHPDLLLALNHFLPNKYQISSEEEDDDHIIHQDEDEDQDHPPEKKRKHAWLPGNSPSVLFNKIRDRCIEKNDGAFGVLIKFSETVLAYHDKRITFYQADHIFKNLFKDDPDLFIESNCVLAQPSLDKLRKKNELLRKGEKKDGENEKSELLRKSEKKSANDVYKETMDVKEFYMFEMDLLFSRLGLTIEKLENNPDRLEGCLTVLDFTCIKKLYYDSDDDDRNAGLGEMMVEILKSDPVGCLGARVVVLERLRQKKIQLEEQKLRLNRIWDEIFEDIKEKGCVCRHREFLRRTKKTSINGYKKQK